jgi:hypothetical protein
MDLTHHPKAQDEGYHEPYIFVDHKAYEGEGYYTYSFESGNDRTPIAPICRCKSLYDGFYL